MTRLHQELNKFTTKTSDETITVSKTQQITIDSRGGNVIKKTKRVNVESGYRRRSFKLSIFFLLLQFLAIVLAYLVVVKDLLIYAIDNKLASDLATVHRLIMIIQLDSFAFTV